MGKQADRYFKVHPWQIIEEGFNPDYSEVAESIFSISNEYMGLRGYFEEGYSGKSLQGSYVGGVYERQMLGHAHYKSMLPFTEMMINTVDWVRTGIRCNGVALDLSDAVISDFVRTLDLRNGALTRSFIWHVDQNTRLKLRFERFLSMERPTIGAQKIEIEALCGVASLRVDAGLDFSRPHRSTGKNHWRCEAVAAENDACSILGVTENTKRRLFAAASFRGLEGPGTPQTSAQNAAVQYSLSLAPGRRMVLKRLACLLCDRDFDAPSAFDAACQKAQDDLFALDYDRIQAESAMWWARQWAMSDIEIDGDEENQQGIRYSIFQLHQTLHTADRSAIIGAKGLTGEAYNGNSFWDTEVYCLPFYLFTNPKAARNLLSFRYNTLPEAKERANALNLRGAFYPIATISGHECCALWQHANLQLQASTGVMHGIWHYTHVTGDTEFLYRNGAEMLIEICRMLDTRGDYSPRTGKYGFYGVMGPDEFQMMVNNNAYTNFMAKRALLYTLRVLSCMEKEEAATFSALMQKTGLKADERDRWAEKAEKMDIPYDEERLLFEQHEGFFNLPHVDIASIPAEQFPLYSHWAYDRLYRNDMIKQPDVLMFMLLFISSFTDAQIQENFSYYTPRCIHESSLSPSVHSILAAHLNQMEQAYDFFGFATRLDLDNYNRNTHEGLHITALAASWMNIVYGFGGLRSDAEILSFWPRIPPTWKRYGFHIRYKGATLSLQVNHSTVHIQSDLEDGPSVMLYGDMVRPTREGVFVSTK